MLLDYRPLTFVESISEEMLNLKVRQSDQHEAIDLFRYPSVSDAILSTVSRATEVFGIFKGEEKQLVGAFGVAKDSNGIYTPWLFLMEGLFLDKKNKLKFLRVAKRITAQWQEKYQTLYNVSSIENKPFLEFLGFEIEQDVTGEWITFKMESKGG